MTPASFDLSRRSSLKRLLAAAAVGALPPIAYGLSRGRLELQPPVRVIDRRYFGLHLHRADAGTTWPPVRFGSWRLWDAYVAWPYLEPKRGEWDFKRLDKYVAMAELTGVDILLPLGLTPAWASARPNEKSSYNPGNAAEPAMMEDWRNYVRTVARRYKGRIHNFEFWNEPNVPWSPQGSFFSGSVESAVALAREAYTVLKEVADNNQLAAPAAVGGGKHLDWLDRYLGAGGKNYLDILSYHFYVGESNPEAMLPLVGKVRDIARKHGLGNVPLWNTEAGWWIENRDGSKSNAGVVSGWKQLNQDEAAAYVARALILGWAAGLERYYWYSWDHGKMGLIEPEDKTLKPAGVAYATVLRWLDGMVMVGCEAVDGLWNCSLKRPDGSTVRIVWIEDGPSRHWSPPTDWGGRQMENLSGVRQPMNTQTKIIIDQSPVLIAP
jgi:hypothetical protein